MKSVAILGVFVAVFSLEIFQVETFTISAGDSIVTMIRTGGGYKFLMPENNHDEDPTRAVFGVSFSDSMFEPEIREDLPFDHSWKKWSGSWVFYTTSSFDYETQLRFYVFDLHLGDQLKTITLYIENIDDEPPSLECPDRLTMIDSQSYPLEKSTCECTVMDPDGFLSQMTFSLSGKDSASFVMGFPEAIPDTHQSAQVKISNLTRLDGTETSIAFFTVQAKDGAGHATTPDPSVDVQIYIENLY